MPNPGLLGFSLLWRGAHESGGECGEDETLVESHAVDGEPIFQEKLDVLIRRVGGAEIEVLH